MNWRKVSYFLTTNDIVKYKQKIIHESYFVKNLTSWDDITGISKTERLLLSDQYRWENLEIVEKVEGKDCIKIKFKLLNDGKEIETVILKHNDNRCTICVSSQVGCALNCAFCATGKMGFSRNLEDYEIYEQVIICNRLLKKENKKVTNIVFMGMGEPMNNYAAVKSAIKELHDKNGFNLGWRNFTISTAGIVNGIKRMQNDLPQVNLAISLHASNETLRTRLMPINHSISINKLISVADEFAKTTKRKVFFEYILLKDVNDKPENAFALIDLMKINHLFHVNLIKYHPIDHSAETEFLPSSNKKLKNFVYYLNQANIPNTLRHSFGTDIKAACGQLITKKINKNIYINLQYINLKEAYP